MSTKLKVGKPKQIGVKKVRGKKGLKDFASVSNKKFLTKGPAGKI